MTKQWRSNSFGGCIGCENIHTIQCRKIYQTFGDCLTPYIYENIHAIHVVDYIRLFDTLHISVFHVFEYIRLSDTLHIFVFLGRRGRYTDIRAVELERR